MGPHCALFDLDGTLTNPETGIVSCMKFALEAVGMPKSDWSTLRSHIGPPLQDAFSQLGVPDASLETAIKAYRLRFEEAGIFENELIPGIIDVLEKLSRSGWSIGIATSKPTVYATQILDYFALTPYFRYVSGATMNGQRRVKSDVIRHALNQLGGSASRAVMIGDRYEDIAGAEVVGVSSIGVNWGFGNPEDFESPSLLATVASPTELLEVLLEHQSQLPDAKEHND